MPASWRPAQSRLRIHVLEGQLNDLQSKVLEVERKLVHETLRADCAGQELDSEKRLRESLNQRALLLEQEKLALQERAHAPPQLLPQQPSASSAGSSSLQLANNGGNLGASAMDNLMLAMASNAQTIQALVGNRQASR
eukprot:COSAG02_NODE_3923_length_6040_cov_1.635078_3_plen_138_part_00